MKRHFILMAIAACFVTSAFSQVVRIDTLTSGLLFPVGIQNTGMPNDDRLFILEKRGRIKIVNRLTGAVTPTPFLDIYSRVTPITTAGDERGLLGLAFHPDYANNGYFFVNYTMASGGHTVIARYQVSSFADTAMFNSEQILMTIYQPYSNHNGGNLMFGKDGYLYISMGDGGSGGDPGNRAQNLDSLLGKTLRIDVNNPNPPYYSSPSTNPFYGPTPGRDEIWNYGMRNHWRCSIDRMTGDIWYGDVGQNAWEEIDFQSVCSQGGENYGWRCYEGNVVYGPGSCTLAVAEYPVAVYSHLLGCSVTGGYVYRGGQEGGLFGKYLFTDYCQGRIWATSPNGSGGWNTVQLAQASSQINNNYSSWGEDIYGELHLAGISSGRIYRLRDTACAPTAYINLPDTIINCTGSPITFDAIFGTGLNYEWNVNNVPVVVGFNSSYTLSTPVNGDEVYVEVSNANCSTQSNTIHIFTDATFQIDSFYCDTAPAAALTGVPAGGTFSGPGISGNIFDPAAAGIGVHVILYTVADTVSSCYYTASGCVLVDTQYVTVDICTGIEEQSAVRNVSVYPNPNNAEFNVELTLMKNTAFTMQVTDALGRNVYERNIVADRGKQNYAVNLSGASEGVYFLFIKIEKASSVFKVIVKK